MVVLVIVGYSNYGICQSWDNYNFSEGNLENWKVIENEDDNIAIIRDFNTSGGFYYSTKNKNNRCKNDLSGKD